MANKTMKAMACFVTAALAVVPVAAFVPSAPLTRSRRHTTPLMMALPKDKLLELAQAYLDDPSPDIQQAMVGVLEAVHVVPTTAEPTGEAPSAVLSATSQEQALSLVTQARSSHECLPKRPLDDP